MNSESTLVRKTLYQIGLVVVFVVIAAALSNAGNSTSFASVEVRFADTSSQGLAIVPASCPSSPHGGSSSECRVSPECPSNLPVIWDNGQCVAGCPAPYVQTANGECTYPESCEFLAQHFPERRCLTDGGGRDGGDDDGGGGSCPLGYTYKSGCVFTGCPAGYTLQNGQCVGQCVAQYYCSGSNLYESCQNSLVQQCAWGCSSGACNSVPAPQIVTWRVSPVLVRAGERTNVEWTTSNVVSCVVTGTNGDQWTGTSGSQVSSPIPSQTIFSITCNGNAGASPAQVSRQTTVNILPAFEEQ